MIKQFHNVTCKSEFSQGYALSKQLSQKQTLFFFQVSMELRIEYITKLNYYSCQKCPFCSFFFFILVYVYCSDPVSSITLSQEQIQLITFALHFSTHP